MLKINLQFFGGRGGGGGKGGGGGASGGGDLLFKANQNVQDTVKSIRKALSTGDSIKVNHVSEDGTRVTLDYYQGGKLVKLAAGHVNSYGPRSETWITVGGKKKKTAKTAAKAFVMGG